MIFAMKIQTQDFISDIMYIFEKALNKQGIFIDNLQIIHGSIIIQTYSFWDKLDMFYSNKTI